MVGLRGLLQLTSVCCLGVVLPAQRTWIVDAANGPGTDYTDVGPALAAAAHGDVVVVRAGVYAFATTSKGVRMLGRGMPVLRGASPTDSFVVRGVPAGQTFVMQGFTLDGQDPTVPIPPPAPPLRIEKCAGLVHLLEVAVHEPSRFDTSIRIDGSTVTMQRCMLAPGPSVTDGRLSASACTILGINYPPGPVTHGVSAIRSVVELSQCVAVGGDALPHFPPGAAVSAAESIVILRGDATSIFRGGVSATQFPALRGHGTSALLRDPAVTLVGGAWYFPLEVTRRLPCLLANGGALGTTLDADLHSPAGDPFLLFASWPIQPVILPPYGERWLDLPALLLATGIQNSTEHWKQSWPLPADPRLLGLTLALQALSGPSPTAELSNPAVVVIR